MVHKPGMLALMLCAVLCEATVRAASSKQAGEPSAACSDCMWGVRLLEDALCDQSASVAVVDWVEKNVCPVLGMGDQCPQLAEALVPVAIEWLRTSATPSSMCSAMGVCGAAVQPLNKALQRRQVRKSVQEGMGCAVCEYLVATVKTEVDDPERLQKIKEEALKACTALPIEFQDSCLDLVNNYGDLIIAAIDDLDPQATCLSVGMCAGKVLSQVKLTPLPPQLIKVVGGMRPLMDPNMRSAANGNMCDMCRLSVLEMHTLIANPDIQKQILDYTKGMCASLGAANADTCKTYVDVYGPAVFVMLQQYLQPDPFCQGIHMCAAPSSQSASKGSKTKRILPGKTLDVELYNQVRRQAASDASAGAGTSSAELREVAALMSDALEVLGASKDAEPQTVDTVGDEQPQDASQPLASLLPSLLAAIQSEMYADASGRIITRVGGPIQTAPSRKLRA